MSNAVEIIDHLKRRFAVDTDSDLALKLLISRSAIANWRSRDHVPDRYARVATGATDWQIQYGMHGGWSDVEREAMVLAVARIVRDFADIGSDYSAFLNKGYEAAWSVQKQGNRVWDF
ncbi:MAG: helix-turn-helix domain-containing protein, partial [Bosea sp. (in: a-proteobacteria)]